MFGELVFSTVAGRQERRPVAKTGPSFLVLDAANRIRCADGEPAPGEKPLLRVDWDAGRCQFTITRASPLPSRELVLVDDVPLGDQPFATYRGCRIQLLGQTVGLEVAYAEAVLDGQAVVEFPVSGPGSWTFGRAVTEGEEEGENKGGRVALDPEARRISTVHAILEVSGQGVILRDVSRYGTYLNGERFKEHGLVYGDRFRIGEYAFEFLVHTVRRVDAEPGGEIMARGVGKRVAVHERETGRKVQAPILANVDLDIGSGEFVGILGGSGQGKSTLMNCLCGIASPTEGEVKVNGMRIADRSALMEAGIGFVPQEDIVHRELTVVQAVSLSAKLKLRLPADAVRGLVESVLDKLGLREHKDKLVGRLSGGQRKRVSIATELLARPRVLFLDEPSSGLDPATEFELMSLLQSLAATGMTVVCTTHVLENAHLFDRLLWVQGGRVVFSGNHRQARDHFLGVGLAGALDTADAAAGSTLGPQKLASLVRVYKTLHESAEPGDVWEERFRSSAFFQEPKPPGPGEARSARPPVRRRVGFPGMLRHLCVRQALILGSERLNLVFLLAQAVLIGFLIAWVGPDPVLRGFLAIVATLWFGCSNGAQQIVSELPVFLRERVSGMGKNAYILSKVGFLGAVTSVQSVILLVTVFTTAAWFHEREELAGREDKLAEILRSELFPVHTRQWNAEEEEIFLTGSFGEARHAVVTKDGLVESALISGVYYQVTDHSAWKPGASVTADVGESLLLPDNLPAHVSEPFPARSVKPGRAESPFVPGAWRVFGPRERDLWKPGTAVRCPLTGQSFVLPRRLPAWPDESIRFRLAKALVSWLGLEEVVLDSVRTQVTEDMRKVGITEVRGLQFREAVGWPAGLLLVAFLAAGTTGVGLGLAISSLVNSPTQAVMWVPLVLIPQILFGGFVVTYPEMETPVRSFSRLVPSFASQRILDVSHVFGRLTPRATNGSKMPVFLGGEREIVEWTSPSGQEEKEYYDRPEDRNVSWQNLLVVPDRVGQRKVEKRYELVYDQRGVFKRSHEVVPDTVSYRDDLRYGYVQGVRYAHVGEAQRSALVLLGWFFACYGLVMAGLSGKERMN